jgi:hypothetical protein
MEDGDDMVISQPKFKDFYFFVSRDWSKHVIWIEKVCVHDVKKMPDEYMFVAALKDKTMTGNRNA